MALFDRRRRLGRSKVISIGLVIGHADGTFDAAERKVVAEACHAVGIAPAEFYL